MGSTLYKDRDCTIATLSTAVQEDDPIARHNTGTASAAATITNIDGDGDGDNKTHHGIAIWYCRRRRRRQQ